MTRQEIVETLVRDLKWNRKALDLAIRADFKCEYCDRCLLQTVEDYDALQIDHIVPDEGDGAENLAVACKTCNFIKRRLNPAKSREDADRGVLIERSREYVAKIRKRKKRELEKVRDLVTQLRKRN